MLLGGWKNAGGDDNSAIGFFFSLLMSSGLMLITDGWFARRSTKMTLRNFTKNANALILEVGEGIT